MSDIATIGEAVRTAHSEQCRSNRSPDASATCYAKLANGSGNLEIKSVLLDWMKPQALSSMGFAALPREVGAVDLPIDDARVACEDDWMQIAVNVSFTLAKNRATSHLWSTDGFPGVAALLLDSDPQGREKGLARCEAMHRAFVAAQDRAEAFVQRMVARSYMSTIVAKIFFSKAPALGFK